MTDATKNPVHSINVGITVTMGLAKSTAGTHVYMEDFTKPRTEKVFPTVYVQRHVLPDPPPQRIEVTVKAIA